MALSGCVVVINSGPVTKDEQALLNIQAQASQEMIQISQKIQKGTYSMAEIQGFINEAKKVIDENLQKLNTLKIPERTKDLAEKTKAYLQNAKQSYESLLTMSAQAGTKIQELLSNLETMSQPLMEMSKQLEKEIQKVTTAK